MRTLEEVNKKHDQRKEFKALVKDLGQKRKDVEITPEEYAKRFEDFERTL